MTKPLSSKLLLLIFSWPLFIILSSLILLKNSSSFPASDQLIIGITLDLVLTMPLVHFLIIRKTKIPNISIVSLFVLGLVVASLMIPKEHQGFLTNVKTYALPMVEILVFTLVAINVIKIT